jgi:superfamily II DNA or RNA helicase
MSTREAQRIMAANRRLAIDTFKAAPDAPYLLGVTATPGRSDGSGLEVAFDELVYQRTISDMIDLGWLCRVRGVRVQTDTGPGDQVVLNEAPLR